MTEEKNIRIPEHFLVALKVYREEVHDIRGDELTQNPFFSEEKVGEVG